MKTIGIIGGLGPPSTVKYYEWLNEGVAAALGGVNAARIILTSVNGEDIKNLRLTGDREAEGAFYAAEAKRLENAGADFILIASNTSHKNAPWVEAAVKIPLLHLADATARHVAAQGVRRVGLLGTRPTMEEDFYISRLRAAGLEVIVPDEAARIFASDAIYNELVKNIVRPETSARYRGLIEELRAQGVEGVILGCTELTLLDLAGVSLPTYDTVRIHVAAALDWALGMEAKKKPAV
jgi:aspartate racemase